MNKITVCPNCKSTNICLCGSDMEHLECYLLMSANKDTKEINIHSGMPLNAYRCLECNYVSFFHAMPEELKHQDKNLE